MRWLHVHPSYVVQESSWAVVHMARYWREGVLPEAGGIHDQAAWIVGAVEIVLTAWGKLEEIKREG